MSAEGELVSNASIPMLALGTQRIAIEVFGPLTSNQTGEWRTHSIGKTQMIPILIMAAESTSERHGTTESRRRYAALINRKDAIRDAMGKVVSHVHQRPKECSTLTLSKSVVSEGTNLQRKLKPVIHHTPQKVKRGTKLVISLIVF